jgi:hypothetical protein
VVRRLAIGFALLLLAAPTASARSFEMPFGTGDLVFVADEEWETSLSIRRVNPPATITAPRELAKGVTCLDRRPLHTCLRVQKRGERVTHITWTVRRPLRIMHMHQGAFVVEIRGARRLVDVFLSGCGDLTLQGRGSYTADGERGAYSPKGPPTLVALEP